MVGGMFFKDADQRLIGDLPRPRPAVPVRAARAQLPALLAVRHACCCTTRCRRGSSGPPRSRTSCSAENERTNWYPATIKHGRYGEWLRNNVDWALSRTRYWGTPLPLWRVRDGPR